MRHLLAPAALATAFTCAAFSCPAFTGPAAAQTVEELQAQLAAQKQINALLKQRVETLEAELAGRTIPPPPKPAAAPEIAAGDPEGDRALERTLERRGAAVLAPYQLELTPSLGWSHSGSDALSSASDSYFAGLEGRVGLPGGWMLGASVPMLHSHVDGAGSNTGIGDVTATVWKSLFAQDGTWPSLVASVTYGAPTGDDFAEDRVPLGTGFHRVTGRLSAVKTIEPIAFYGEVSYTHFLSETISGFDVERSDTPGFGLGASLAVTPEVSVSAGLNFAFSDGLEVDNVKVAGTDATVGIFDIGVGILLDRDLFLTFTGGLGITDDSPDVTLGVSLPIRF